MYCEDRSTVYTGIEGSAWPGSQICKFLCTCHTSGTVLESTFAWEVFSHPTLTLWSLLLQLNFQCQSFLFIYFYIKLMKGGNYCLLFFILWLKFSDIHKSPLGYQPIPLYSHRFVLCVWVQGDVLVSARKHCVSVWTSFLCVWELICIHKIFWVIPWYF